MKTRKFLLGSLMAIASVGLIFTSCKKDKSITEQEDSDVQAAEDYAQADFVYSDVTNIVDDGARNETGINKMGTCPTITKDTVLKTITFDWGTGCEGPDGRTRKGKIKATLTGKYKEVGSAASVEFIDYYVSGFKAEGKVTLTRNEQFAHRLEVTGGKITNPNNKTITWSCNVTRKCISDKCDSATTDGKKYSVTGYSTGTNIQGVKFLTEIKEALIIEPSCVYKITKGILELNISPKPTRTINFGDGACDDVITITIKGKTYSAKLPDKAKK